MASLRKERREGAQFRVLRLIAQNSELTTRQIADDVGISTGAAYHCVTALVEKGLVKLENFNDNPRKGQYAYMLTPRGIREKAALTVTFLEREVGLDGGAEPARVWGASRCCRAFEFLHT